MTADGNTLICEHPVRVTNLDKVLWPEAGITKAEYIQYIIQMASYLIPHLKNRPLTVIRFPDGIHAHSFYQKNAPKETPKWVNTYPVWSEESKRTIHYMLANDTSTLIWLANHACIELHPWFSQIQAPNSPTNIAFDLDPSVPGFEKVREVALRLKEVLDDLGLPSYPKTSGASGIQIFIPLALGFSYEDTRMITSFIGRFMAEKYPKIITVERMVKDRGDKVYIDYLQHAPNKTLIAPYSARAVAKACVSAPLTWEELQKGVVPEDFTIVNMVSRVNTLGDLFAPLTRPGVDIGELLQLIRQHSSS
ncbi:DNA polymerase domain-containing protein [Collibacillus ludicampi]|uniref:DNA polymerase domain-containing protein n=1 Tax=Collibacillus ludicampi TaxID=2771369 RepID=A0AAV4LJM8_9BACL|nr:non-homologous end-joining DNA ligase [Collibacillus ludicampi]GIM48056.1 DNA polymerase domain-containing protein [Collibacillus ludicampi]